MIYFDHQSTSPTDPRVVDVMPPYFSEHFGNSQARFVNGEQPRQAIQENRKRAGTENVSGIISMGKAAEMPPRLEKISQLGKMLIEWVQKKITKVHLTGHPEKRLPGHAGFCFEFVEGEPVLLFLPAQGIEVANGSTCSSQDLKASHVLMALGAGDLLTQGSLLFSPGKENREAEETIFLEKLPSVVDRLRSMSPVHEGFDYN